jgi:predicted MPP superfamily phosphohydrolase
MKRRTFLKLALFGGAAALTGSYPILIERNLVQVNRYRIPVPDLPASFHGFTIAHLTDLHFGPLVSGSFIEKIVHRTNKLRTDVIFCTGDFVHGRNSIGEIENVWPILSRLEARQGVYSVLGNHDHWADPERSIYWLERTGQNIRHGCRPVYRGKDRILIGGAGDYWEDDLKIDKTFSCSNENECRILLSHNPDSIDTEYKTPLSLVVSGHTHGGQVVIPFYGAPILPVKNKQYSSGLIETPKTRLFISRGIGWSIYPVRFNCYPEIAFLELFNPRLTA